MVGARSWLAGLMFSPGQKRRRSLAVIAALSLGAAACGSGDEAAPSLTLAPQDSSAVVDDTVEGAAPDTSAEVTQPPTDEAAAPDVVNLFPDIDVLDVADGSTVNLAAALGGFDRPTLLWFWAPH